MHKCQYESKILRLVLEYLHLSLTSVLHLLSILSQPSLICQQFSTKDCQRGFPSSDYKSNSQEYCLLQAEEAHFKEAENILYKLPIGIYVEVAIRILLVLMFAYRNSQ
jgi:hypothetical protein